jgi:hypothetical protein
MFWLGAQRSQSFNNGWQTLSTLELVKATPAIIAAYAVPGFANTYLTVEQAPQAIFQGASFDQLNITLTPDQQKNIESRAWVRVRSRALKVWKVRGGEKPGGCDFCTLLRRPPEAGSVYRTIGRSPAKKTQERFTVGHRGRAERCDRGRADQDRCA